MLSSLYLVYLPSVKENTTKKSEAIFAKKFWLLCKSKFLFLVQQNWTFEFSVKAIQSDSNVFLIPTPLQKQYINNDFMKKKFKHIFFCYLPIINIYPPAHNNFHPRSIRGSTFGVSYGSYFGLRGVNFTPHLTQFFASSSFSVLFVLQDLTWQINKTTFDKKIATIIA